jgi:hypothetical protein
MQKVTLGDDAKNESTGIKDIKDLQDWRAEGMALESETWKEEDRRLTLGEGCTEPD